MLSKNEPSNTNEASNKLDAKMKQSLDSLIQLQELLLSGKSKKEELIPVQEQEKEAIIQGLDERCQQLTEELAEKNILIAHQWELHREEQLQLQQRLDSMTQEHSLEQESSRQQMKVITTESEELKEKNLELNGIVQHLQELYEAEVQRKDQLELLLKENAQELKEATENALERDEKIEKLEHSVHYLEQMMKDKDALLESYMTKESDKVCQLEQRISQLQQENQQLIKDKRQQKENDTNNSNDALFSLKQELVSSQAQLVEKISQNKELESAMERVNEHCEILRTGLVKSREESADRYKKILSLHEEIRLLKQALHSSSNSSSR